jgi:DNA-binding NarL/FixJ family response regulator
MKVVKSLNVALLDEDKFSSLGMKALLQDVYSPVAKVDVFHSFNELAEMPSSDWDVIIIDMSGIEFTLLAVFTWLDEVYESHKKRPKVLFTHRYPEGQFPIAILKFYSCSIYNKAEPVLALLRKVNNILHITDSKRVKRPYITRTEKAVLVELAKRKSINYLSQSSGREQKTLYSHKNSALAKLGVTSSDHFFANYNGEQFSALMKLSCFA